MAFENFPYTNLHELNLDWILQELKTKYGPDNLPENIVLSINGQTGHVELFTENLIRLPDVPDNVWNIYRVSDGEAKGIQFDGDGAYRIYRDQRYRFYDEDNEPDYPVTSVNGQTGDVTINIPAQAVRSVNGKTGAVITPFTNPNGDILALDTNAPGNRWGISRQTSQGNASIVLTTTANGIQAFLQFAPADGGAVVVTPLLTSAEIPESAGVVSINSKTGVVTLYGSDIYTTLGGNTTIAQDISQLNSGLASETNTRQTADNALESRLNAEIADRQQADNTINADMTEMGTTLTTAINNETSARENADTDMRNRIMSVEESAFNITANINLWTQGTYSASSGAINDRDIYIRTTDYIADNIDILRTIADGYDMRLFAWDANDTYVGVFNTNNTFVPISTNNMLFHIINLNDFRTAYPTYKFKVVLQKNPLATILLTDSSNAEFIESIIENHTSQIESLEAAIENIQSGAGVTKITIPEVVTLPCRYPDTGTDARITTSSECMLMELSRPGVQHSDWTIETFAGYLTISGTIHGLTDITLYMI